ncbi:tetratricopeptide repeat protein [Comamonas flocculans]|uniref:Tetratricopeptide repeat protein n=1 Tax=Comamonas flocculans TaxID=2597701 RepID=A0A5B8RUX0_9BURK|nr:tetratricopeptide repeat protein [Comamonas flocculans]QEA12474.1 tetratricopeptide repeat protein [Comamonas flocculans]
MPRLSMMNRGGVRRGVSAALLALSALALVACSSPEEKVASFAKKGQSYLQAGDVVKARLEFQNALQINPNNVPSLYGLAEIAERGSDWNRTYGLLSKVVELDPTNLAAHLKLGKLLLAAGQMDKALTASEAASRLKADDADVLALRAAVMFKLGDRKAAVDLAQQALSRNPKQSDALVVLASQRLMDGDGDGALKYLDQALADNERDVALQLIKVQALEKMSRLDGAQEVFRKLIAFYPDNKVLRHMLAQFFMTHGMPAQAEDTYRDIVKAQPRDTEAKLDLVRFVGQLKGPAAAAAELQEFIKQDPKAWDLKLMLANLRQQENKPEAARALWNEVVAEAGKDPAGLRARAALAADLLGNGKRAEANELIAQILEADARNEQGLLLRAGVALDERRLDDAVADLRTILRDTPSSAQAHAMLGRTLEMQGSKDLAQDEYARAAQEGKFAPLYAMPYAEFLMRVGKPRLVEPALRETLQVAPHYLPAYQLLAQSYLNVGELVSAQKVADLVAKLGNQQVAANQLQGAVAAARNQFDSSIAAYRKAYELSPDEMQPMVALVGTYLRAGKLKEAQGFLQSVIAASPDNVGARLLQARLAAQSGDAAGAKQGFEEVLKRNPESAQAYLGLVGLLSDAGQFDEADALLVRALERMPGDFGLRLSRASLYEQRGKVDDALALYEKLNKERPNAEVVVNNLASLLTDARTDEASHKRAYELAQGLRSSNVPQFKDTFGWAAYRVGRYSEAATPLRDAAKAMPDLPVLHYHLGMNLLAQGNKTGAREALQHALDLATRGAPFAQADEAKKALAGI